MLSFEAVMVTVLLQDQAGQLLAPDVPGGAHADARSVFTIHVEDVDDEVARLADLAVRVLNGPMDRPWGVRTVSFRDPGG